jgi:glycine hydroxymethyltransferase
MIITIAAITPQGVIGNKKENKIPWNIPEDMELFKNTTMNHAVIMGSTTYKSIGKALEQRENFVISSKLKINDAKVFPDFNTCLNHAKKWVEKNNKNIFIIGGAKTYKEGIKHSQKLYLSKIKKNYEGDILFPKINWEEWELEKETIKEFKEFTLETYKKSNATFKLNNSVYLKEADKEVYDIMIQEIERLNNSIELIASENVVSTAVLEATGSVFTNKYAEGYPGKRYYGGCTNVDAVEDLAKKRLSQLFNCEEHDYCVNVQPHSGSQANMAVYLAMLNPGDKILGMDLSAGGHLTHGSSVNFSGKLFNFISYGTNKEGFIDYEEVREIAIKEKPKMIVVGASAYPRIIDFKKFSDIAKETEAYLFADIAHIAGLIVAKKHSSPIGFADFITSTTHKTLRGPRGGIIISKKEFEKKINSAIFPGIQGGPLEHVIAAKAVAFKEALSDEFKEYQEQIIKNAKILSETLIENGINLVSNGTDNHLLLINLSALNMTGKTAEKLLEDVGITTNKNGIPNDPQPPWITSGIRIGTPAITTRGFKETECREIGEIIADVLKNGDVEQNKQKVKNLCNKFKLFEMT